MTRNCFQFDPVGTPVNLAGIEPQRLFDDKRNKLTMMMWMPRMTTVNAVRSLFFLQFPILTEPLCLGIAEMEKQIEAMWGTISVP